MFYVEQYLTYINTGVIVAASIVAFLRWLAPKTTTTFDDDLVKNIDKKYAWLNQNALPVYNTVEMIAAQNKWTSVTKWTEFLKLLNRKYEESYATALPSYLETAANSIVTVKASYDKVKTLKEDVELQIEQAQAQLKRITGGEAIGPHDVAQEDNK